MPVANVVGQVDNLLIDGQHPFWNGFQASGPPVGRIPSSVQRASNILLLDIHRHRRLLRARRERPRDRCAGKRAKDFSPADVNCHVILPRARRVHVLKETVPSVSRVVVIFNPATAPFAEYVLKSLNDAATHRVEIISLAARYRLPAVYPFRFFAELGGLISYGVDLNDNFRRAVPYADRILKGAKPSELPVQAPVKFELVINLKTAKALGLTVPPTLLNRADEVIE